MHDCAGGDRSLPTAIETFIQSCPSFQHRYAAFAATRTDKAVRPAPLEQERRATLIARKLLLKFRKWSPSRHPNLPSTDRKKDGPVEDTTSGAT